jgi:dimeric dUTPase (all-alpha-NTP-PPase superfamily)
LNLAKLYKAQAKLDADIIEKKGLQGRNLLPNKILALNVELGELAQEVQGGWKYWKEHTTRDDERALDEFVDCLHFALSIGLSRKYKFDETYWSEINHDKIRDQLITVFVGLNDFADFSSNENYQNLLFHLIKLGNMLGFTNDQIEAQYFNKNKVNFERQEADY